jgi:hypothetical protein
LQSDDSGSQKQSSIHFRSLLYRWVDVEALIRCREVWRSCTARRYAFYVLRDVFRNQVPRALPCWLMAWGLPNGVASKEAR